MSRRVPSRMRWFALVVSSGLVLAGCGGFDVLLQLGATVDMYFTYGDFDPLEALDTATAIGKALGTGSF